MASTNSPRNMREASLTPPPALLSASDDVLIMILEKTSAMGTSHPHMRFHLHSCERQLIATDIVHVLQTSKTLYQRISPNVDHLARSFIKVEEARLSRDAAYLDIRGLDIAHGVKRFTSFFRVSCDRSLDWPDWLWTFVDVYMASADDDEDFDVLEVNTMACLKALGATSRFRMMHQDVVTGTPLRTKKEQEIWRRWSQELEDEGRSVDPSSHADYCIERLCGATDEDYTRMEAMFAYAERADIFGSTKVTGAELLHRCSKVLTRSSYAMQGYAPYSMLREHHGLVDFPSLPLPQFHKYCSMSGHKKLLLAARAAAAAEFDLCKPLSPLAWAAILEDMGVCLVVAG